MRVGRKDLFDSPAQPSWMVVVVVMRVAEMTVRMACVLGIGMVPAFVSMAAGVGGGAAHRLVGIEATELLSAFMRR
jgi:hypothetical protein